MSRAWWGWATRWNGPDSDGEPPVAPEPAPDDQPGRLQAPRGVETWIVLTQSGGKFAFDHEWEANNRAALHKGSVVYPVRVELEESA